MPKIPQVSGKEAVAVLERFGWAYRRRESSHMILKKQGVFCALSIPDKKRVAPGTLRDQLRLAGISVDDFAAALRALK